VGALKGANSTATSVEMTWLALRAISVLFGINGVGREEENLGARELMVVHTWLHHNCHHTQWERKCAKIATPPNPHHTFHHL